MFKNFREKLPSKLYKSKIWNKQSKESQKKLEFDKQLVFKQSRTKKLPNLRQIKYISSFFSARERLAIVASFLGILIACGFIAFFVYIQFVELVPEQGGTYREALVGTPLYINPILAGTNDVDLDLTKLMFSGLLKYDHNLQLQPDLAESWNISEDGKVYTATLRENLFWHDDTPLTIDDVIFTFKATQDPSINSPLQLSLQNVLIEKADERTVSFTLENPFTPFASILTVGIVPNHIWASIPASNVHLAERNIKPIGSGAWKFHKLEKDKQGNIHSYTLAPFEKYHLDQPYAEELSFRFFPNFVSAIEALNNQKVEGISFLPRQMISSVSHAQNFNTHHLQLPQYTSIFFNQDKNDQIKDLELRQSLAYSIDRNRMIKEVLDGLGQIVNGPLLPDMPGFDPDVESFEYNPIEAKTILDEAGWEELTAEEYIEFERAKILAEQEEESDEEDTEESEETDEEAPEEEIITPEIEIDTGNQVVFRKKDDTILEIRLTTVDQPENVRAAEIIRDVWTAVGVKVELEIVSVNVLINDILPARDYEALLYSQILNVFPDLYAFWHSSQVDYPGLNLANYADKDADELLESARATNNVDEQTTHYKEFQQLLHDELPAIFLYSPKYTYLLPIKIKGFEVDRINIPADRWNNINQWYVNTKKSLLNK